MRRGTGALGHVPFPTVDPKPAEVLEEIRRDRLTGLDLDRVQGSGAIHEQLAEQLGNLLDFIDHGAGPVLRQKSAWILQREIPHIQRL